MIIEATEKPFKYQWSRGEITLTPGTPVTVEPELGQRIIQKCGNRVREVPSPEAQAFALNLNEIPESVGHDLTKKATYQAGSTVVYQSPLFGELRCLVIEDLGGVIWLWHPIRECESCIPRAWVIGEATTHEEKGFCRK